jgi:para-aminobenzoate synthetase/4-amino-4-deoxychorismate lyase
MIMSDHTKTKIELVGQGWGLFAKQKYSVSVIEQVLQSHDANDVIPILQSIETHTQHGKYAFGFIAYEAASAFGLPVNKSDSTFPLLWFAIVDAGDVVLSTFENPIQTNPNVNDIHLTIDEVEYQSQIKKIKQQIEWGNTYQTNYTIRALSESHEDARNLFYPLYQNQPVPYAALIETDNWSVISLSPELFLKREGYFLQSKPMKGTHKRGRYIDEDNKYKDYLKTSEKECAENIMIVDMMRNDLGRISKYSSVVVGDVYHVEPLRTVLQMTSTVNSELKRDVPFTDIMRATFPAASVTGAPKHKTMEMIRELEDTPRGVYCGAVGMIKPGGDFVFNVAIRTLMKENEKLVCGVGSGIVWDSEAENEYQEIHTKTLFLQKHNPPFQLIETVLLNEQSELVYLDEHVSRLKQSAEYFGYLFDDEMIRNELLNYAKSLNPPCAIRLLLSEDGEILLSNRTITSIPDHPKIVISDKRVDSDNPFYFHKTTNRDVYNSEREKANANGAFEVIFLNEKGYVTEGSISNIFIHKNGTWVTPPIEDGLLNGVWRQKYLAEHKGIEMHLTLDDMLDAERIVVGNSVMGAVGVTLMRLNCTS